MYIIAGLGNPGISYENTRHNVGFKTIDLLANRLGISVAKKRFNALTGEGAMGREKVALLKPQTYMNLSGESLIQALKWHKVGLDNLIVIYDDVDLDVGKIRIKPRGSAGTHNGMRSVVDYLDSEDFARVRIGIGKPPIADYELADYVLSRFSEQEKSEILKSIENAADAVAEIIQKGIESAMNKYN